MSSSPRQPYSLRTRKRPAGAKQQDDDSASPASGSRQDDDDQQAGGASDSSASSGESDDEEDDTEDEWSEASEKRGKNKFGKGRGKRPVKQKQQSPTVVQQRPHSPLPLPYPRRFVPSNDTQQPPTPLPIPGAQAEAVPQQQLLSKATQSFSNVPLKRPAPPVSAASHNGHIPVPPPRVHRPAKRVPPRPFPSLFVSPPTPALWYLHSRIGEVLNAARLEGTRDESLQMASHQAVETALAGLPTRQQQVAMGLIMNRYSTFLTHPSISLPIYPITAPKVALFLSRILPTPLGTQFLALFPQPSSNPLPLANGIDRDLFPLGPGEGERVSAELVKCWVDALGFAQGVSANVWRGLISLESQRPVGGDLAVLEVCRGIESVRTMLPLVREAGVETGRAMGMPEKKKAKWTKGGKEVEAPVKTSSPPRLNVSREISNARDLSPPAFPAEMFGEAVQGSQTAFGARDLRTALSINGAPIPAFASAPQGPFSLPKPHSTRTASPHQNGAANSHVAADKEGEGDAEGPNLLVDSPTALSPSVSLSAPPPAKETNSPPPPPPTTRRSTRGRSTSVTAASSAEPAVGRAGRRGSTSLAAQATQGSPSSANGAEESSKVSSRTRSRSISVGAGVAAEKGETAKSTAAVRRSPRKSGVDGGGRGEKESEKEAQAPSSERVAESEVEAVRARKEGRAGQKRQRSSDSLGAGDGGDQEAEKEGGATTEEAPKESTNAEEQPSASAPATDASSKDQQPSTSTLDASSDIPPPLSNAEIEAALAAVNGLAPPLPPAPISGITPTPPPAQHPHPQSQHQHQRSFSSSLDNYARPPSAANRGGAGPRNLVPVPLEIPRGLPGFSNGAASASSWNHHPHAQHQHHSRQGFVDPYAGFAPPPPSRSAQAMYGAEYSYHSQSQQYPSHGYSQAQSWDEFPPPSQQHQGYYARAPPPQGYASSHSPSFGRFSQSPSLYHQHQPYSPHQPHPHSHQQYTSRSQYSPTGSGSPGWPLSTAPPPLSLSHPQHHSHIQPPYPTPGTPYWTGGAPQSQHQGGSAFGAGAGGIPMMRGNGPPLTPASGMARGGEEMSMLGGGAGEGGDGMGLDLGAGAGSSIVVGGGGTSSNPSRAGTPQQPGMASGWHPLE